MIRARFLLLLLVAATGLSISVSAASTATAQTPTTSCDDPGVSIPVVLVHGWRGLPAVFDVLESQMQASGLDVAVTRFDYSDDNTEWVTHPQIGPRLREVVRCLAGTSRRNGGPGRVALMGHSMGGLAIRDAIAGDPDVGLGVMLVVTFATPNDGSFWAGSNDPVGWITEEAVELVAGPGLYLFTDDPEWRSGVKFGPAFGALSVGSPELARLPELPRSIPVAALATEIVLEENYFFLTNEVGRYGDGIVSMPSATSRGLRLGSVGGVDVEECRLLAPSVAPNTPFVLQAPFLWKTQRDQFASCWHSNVPSHAPLVQEAIRQLVAASSIDEPPSAIREFLAQWHDANARCRGGSGDDPATWDSCVEALDVSGELESLGWCYGPPGEIGANLRWAECVD